MSLELYLVGENHNDPKYSERVIGFLESIRPDVAAFESGKICHYYTNPEILAYCKIMGIKMKSIDLITTIYTLALLLDNPFVKSPRELIREKTKPSKIFRNFIKKYGDQEALYLADYEPPNKYEKLIDLLIVPALRERLMSISLRKLSGKSVVAFVGANHIGPIYDHLQDLSPKKYLLYEADNLSV